MNPILAQWNFSSSQLQLFAAQKGFYAIVWSEGAPHRIPLEGLPSISSSQLPYIFFQSDFFPTLSRLDNGGFGVQLHVKGNGGCFPWCKKKDDDSRQPLLQPRQPKKTGAASPPTMQQSQLPQTGIELVKALAGVEKKSPLEQTLLHIALEMIKQFDGEDLTSSLVDDLVMLVNAGYPELTHKVLEKLISRIHRSVLVPSFLINGLGCAIEEASFTDLKVDDVVQILTILTDRLEKTHWPDAEKTIQELMAIVRIFNAMTGLNTKGLKRKDLHSRIYQVLDKISQSDDLDISLWANYAKQALVRIPDDESLFRCILRKSGELGATVLSLGGGVYNMNPGSLLSALMQFKKFCTYQDRKKLWYDEIRICEWLIGKGEFEMLEKSLSTEFDTHNPYFAFTLTYRLDEYIQKQLDHTMQKMALRLLENMFFNQDLWSVNSSLWDRVKGRDFKLCLKERLIGQFLAYQTILGLAPEVDKILAGVRQDLAFNVSIQPRPFFWIRESVMPHRSSVSLAVSRRLPEEAKLQAIRESVTGDRDFIEASRFYIPSFGTRGAGAFDLQEEVTRFLTSDKKVLLLLGNAGLGKSLFCQTLATVVWHRYKMGGVIPLFISLPSLRDPLKSAIPETLKEFGFTDLEVDELRQKRQFVFILDGFDEINQWHNLYATNQLSKWRCQVIISCRTQYLSSVANYLDYFIPQGSSRTQNELFTEISVAPFNPSQRDEFLQRFVPQAETSWNDWRLYRDQIEKIPGLAELTQNPFILKITAEVLPDIVIKHQSEKPEEELRVTQLDLYNAFIEHWFDRQKAKLVRNGSVGETRTILGDFHRFCQKLSVKMTEKGVTQVFYKEESNLFGNDARNEWEQFFGNQNPRIVTARSGAPLRQFAPYQWGFLHDSLRSYFYAQSITYSSSQTRQLETEYIPPNRGQIVANPNVSAPLSEEEEKGRASAAASLPMPQQSPATAGRSLPKSSIEDKDAKSNS
jgi:hypothetical protein